MTRSNAALATLTRDVLPHPWLAEHASETASFLALRGSDQTIGEIKGPRSCVCFRVVEPYTAGKLVGHGCCPQEGHTNPSRKGTSQSAGRQNRGMASAGAQHCGKPVDKDVEDLADPEDADDETDQGCKMANNEIIEKMKENHPDLRLNMDPGQAQIDLDPF